jgi:hypothetical protein
MNNYGIKYDMHDYNRVLYDQSTVVLFASDKQEAINILANSLTWRMEYHAISIKNFKKL